MPFPTRRSYPSARTYPARRAYPSSRLYPGEIPAFPTPTIDFFDAQYNRYLDATCCNYQLVDHDAIHGQVLWYPNGPDSTPTGTLLVYNVGSDFFNGSGTSYKYAKLPGLYNNGQPAPSGAIPAGFGGGFMDGPAYQYAYLCPSKRQDSPTQAAVATAVVNGEGQVTALTFSNYGAGYTVRPSIGFEGGGGTGAAAHVTGVSGGAITGYAIDSGGQGYSQTSPPQVGFTPQLTRNTLAVQVNLATLAQDSGPPITDTGAFSYFDLTTMSSPPPRIGYFQGVWCNGCAYYAPCRDLEVSGNDPTPGAGMHGNFLRYNPANGTGFADYRCWDYFDLTTLPAPPGTTYVPANFAGYQSIAAAGTYVYLIPYGLGTGYSYFIRYDTTQGFQRPAAYRIFDLSTLDPVLLPRGFTGGVVTPNGKLVLIPWKDSSLTTNPVDGTTANLMYTAVCYDTTQPFTVATSYQAFNLLDLSPTALGYEYGWLDKQGFVWFVTTGLYNPMYHQDLPVPIVAWNSYLPFSQASSWIAYPDPGVAGGPGQVWLPTSAGAAYDPVTDAAWWACWGTSGYFLRPPSNTSNGVIVRVRCGR